MAGKYAQDPNQAIQGLLNAFKVTPEMAQKAKSPWDGVAKMDPEAKHQEAMLQELVSAQQPASDSPGYRAANQPPSAYASGTPQAAPSTQPSATPSAQPSAQPDEFARPNPAEMIKGVPQKQLEQMAAAGDAASIAELQRRASESN